MATKEELKAAIKAAGMTQAQAAKFLGLSVSSIQKRIAGDVPVRNGEMVALKTYARRVETCS